VFINKLSQNIKKWCINRQIAVTLISCVLLFLCNQLSAHASDKNTLNPDAKRKGLLQNMMQDPTGPPNMMAVQLSESLKLEPKFELTAIFTRNAKQYAVVNGNIVTTGDTVADMFVIDITNDQVVMENPQSKDAATVIDLAGAISVKKQVTK